MVLYITAFRFFVLFATLGTRGKRSVKQYATTKASTTKKAKSKRDEYGNHTNAALSFFICFLLTPHLNPFVSLSLFYSSRRFKDSLSVRSPFLV